MIDTRKKLILWSYDSTNEVEVEIISGFPLVIKKNRLTKETELIEPVASDYKELAEYGTGIAWYIDERFQQFLIDNDYLAMEPHSDYYVFVT